MGLSFDTDPQEATWLAERLSRGSAEHVSLSLVLGPPGFEAYARVLSLPDPSRPGQPESDIDDATLEGSPSDVVVVSQTLDELTGFTTVPNELCFLFWDGWPFDPPLPVGNRVDVAHRRRYALATGTRDEWLAWASSDREGSYPPSFVWPSDRAWCIAYDVDAHFAGVGASDAAIDSLLSNSRLASVRTDRKVIPALYG